MIGIYKITNPKGRVYIGQSTNIEKRFNHYRLKDCKGQRKLYNSLLKYGLDNHKFDVIEECIEQHLTEREGYWQDYYNCINNGMNCRRVSTSDKTGYMSKETKKKIGKANKGRIYSDEVLENIRRLRKLRIISDETRKKISDSHKTRIVSESSKKSVSDAAKLTHSKKVLNMNTNEIYNSCTDAAKALGLNRKTLSKWLSGSRKNKTNLIYLSC